MQTEASKQVELFKIFQEKAQLSADDADTLSHALVDIDSSFEKIFKIMLPKIQQLKSKEEVVDLLLEIREEFTHIQYHIEDAKLTDLSYVKY